MSSANSLSTALPSAASQRVSIQDVAEHAGVAISSVSRVLTGHPDVSERMRARVMESVEALGYEPDWVAQSLRLRETHTVGFTVPDIANRVMAEIVTGAETELRARGYSLVLTNSEGDGNRDAEHIMTLGRRRVDGLLVATAVEGNRATIRALRAFDIPVVIVDRNMPKNLGASTALFDHRTGMREAVAHLLDLGHRRISLLLGQRFRPTVERRRGLEDAYRDRELQPTFDILEGHYDEEHGMAATREALDKVDSPTAIIAGSNQLLTGALREIKRRGLVVGRDISLASCDEVSLTELYDPPIAVVHRDNVEMGRRSAALLLARLAGERTPASVTLPTWFEARPSCMALASGVGTTARSR
jgi:LacI family transcriptional regulator